LIECDISAVEKLPGVPPGIPGGNKNALKHGLYTREAIAQRRQFSELMRQSRKMPLKIE
jgi:hypothetical protein